MRFSQMLIPTLREAPSEAQVISHQLMLRAGYIRKLAAGVYTYLPLGLKVLRKIETIVREELNKAGAQELLLPIVMPAELWQETGRWGVYGKELLRFKDRSDRDFCFGPTHEEAITDLARNTIHSWRDMPKNLFQIQTKFRDETRPRFGLMRGREFIMKDSYSFDVDEAASKKTYQKMYETYEKIFGRCGLKFRAVEAGTGNIGGTLSHEFQVLADSGEDAIFACNDCKFATNTELLPSATAGAKCPRCNKGTLESFRGIEVGQVFYLGTKYSSAMQANFLDKDGKSQPMVMGCYGIGIGRTAAAAIEQNHDAKGIIWPQPIAPFAVEIIAMNQDGEVLKAAGQIYDDLQSAGVEVLYDDRDERAGVKFADFELIGIPSAIVVGAKGLKEEKVEWKDRRSGVVQKFPLSDVIVNVRKAIST